MSAKSSFLLLPVRVLACAFDPSHLADTWRGDGTARWSWTQPDYSGLAVGAARPLGSVWPSLFNAPAMTTPSAAQPDSRPAEDGLQVGLPPPLKGERPRHGVCLSWSVPPGWSRVPTRESEVAALPRLPDRWLVARFARKTHHKGAGDQVTWAPREEPAVRLWIVDAGVPVDDEQEAPSAGVLMAGRDGVELRRVGVVRSLDAARGAPAEEARVPLYIQGSERSPDLTFGAFAPANLNNLSFIDPLDDVAPEGCALSYAVIGWYRQPGEHDPLATLPAGKVERREALRALGLDPIAALVDGETTEAQARKELRLGPDEQPPRGDRCLFHGMVAYVDYFNPSSYRGPAFGSPPPEQVATLPPVGFGVTAEQALARVCAGVSKDDAASAANADATFLEQLLTDQLWTVDALGGSELERRAAIASRFRAVQSGTEWVVAAAREERAPAPAPKGPPAAVSLTPEQRRALHGLNEAQRALDEDSAALVWAVENLYACWWLLRTEPAKAQTALDLGRFLDAYRGSVLARRAALEAQRKKLDAQKAALSALLAAAPERKLVLEARDAAPFFAPKEPAVALRNLGPRIPLRAVSPMGRLARNLAARREGGAAPPRDRWLARLGEGLRDEGLRDVLASVLIEGQLVEAWVADAVRHHTGDAVLADADAWQQRASKLRELLGEDVPKVSTYRTNFDARLLPAEGAEALVVGALCTVWTQQPWVPLFLDWEARWFPKPRGTGVRFQGRTILAHRPQSVIRSRRAVLERAADVDGAQRPNLAEQLHRHRSVLQKAEEADVVAQTLSGIEQQILARNDALPRVVPAPDDPVFAGLADLVGQTSLGPLWRKPDEAYAPGRSSLKGVLTLDFSTVYEGSLSIERLWVVDRFGQAFVMGNPDSKPPTRPKLAVPGAIVQSATEGHLGVKLERRMLEPMRLSVRFEMPEGSSSRVRGWVLPNLLDKSLVVYDEHGSPLGVVLAAGAEVTWQPVRADAHKPAAEVVKDAALRALVARLVVATGDNDAVMATKKERFKALLQQIDDALPRTQPAGAQEGYSSASLLGRPLALVRVGLSVERKGGPTFNPNWLVGGTLDKLTANFDEALAELRPVNPKDTLSIKIGSRYLPDDGVIGYWLDEPKKDALQRTRKVDAGAAPDKDALQRTRKVDAGAAPIVLQVPGYRPEPPQRLDLLLDPRGKLHLDPDVLTASVVGLAPEWYEDELRRLPAVVRVTSVLLGSPADLARGAGRRIDLPLPAGSVKASVELSPVAAAPASAQPAPAQPAPAKRAPEVLLRIHGAELTVEPSPPLASLPEGEVAAADGFLIV